MSPRTGRPRNSTLDAAIAAAAKDVLLSDGYAAVTVERVAAVAHTSRTAVYRRFANRVSLVTSVVLDMFGTDPAPDTGCLRRDLTDLQLRQQEFFQAPVVRAAVAGGLSDILADSELRRNFHAAFMIPRRASTALMLQRGVDRGEIPPVADAALISDMLTGPLLLRAIMPVIGPIDDALIHATVESALHLLAQGGALEPTDPPN